MRLIDADALKEQFREGAYTVKGIREEIDNAPTVDVKPFASVTFGKEQLEQIVRDRVIEPIKNGELVVEAEERPQGEWIFDSEFTMFGNPYGTYKCSCCGGHSSDKYSFCKDCGADMRKEESV